MSTQSALSVPFSFRPAQQGYRLIELPAELASALESPNPPTLKLEPSPTAALLKIASPGANKQTWSLRQKNTSNAIVLLSPTQAGDETVTTSASPTAGGVCAIATLHETIELVPEDSQTAAPAVAAKGKWHEKFSRGR